ncbi:hypothetical protein LINGRAPRIM_LOCUS569 [Linum grandiflorum]
MVFCISILVGDRFGSTMLRWL